MNIIFTTYFTSRKNPQRDKFVAKNAIGYMKSFYDSINELKLDCVIFHDELSDSFIDKYSTEKIKFNKVDMNKYNRSSLNDLRFYYYLDYINEHPDIEKVFMTDISDVVVNINPFDYITDDNLYIGLDRDRTLEHYFMKDKIIKAYGCFSRYECIKSNKTLNAGIIGGNITTIKFFLKELINEFRFANKVVNANMPSVNYVAYKFFDEKITTGYPLCSKFCANEIRKDVYFKHK